MVGREEEREEKWVEGMSESWLRWELFDSRRYALI